MITEETINEIKSQLWNHLQCLIGRIEEVGRMGYTVQNWGWLTDQHRFCKSEIAYWKNH